MIRFTENCEEAIKRGSLMQYLKEVEGQLEGYTNVDLGGVSGTEAAVLELKLKALILDTIHNMDVVRFLLDSNTQNPGDWMWQKQLRYVRQLSRCLPVVVNCLGGVVVKCLPLERQV